MKLSRLAFLLLAVVLSGCKSFQPQFTEERGYFYTHAETTGNCCYLRSSSGEFYEIEFCKDPSSEAFAAFWQLYTSELSSKEDGQNPKIAVYGQLASKTHITPWRESAYYFILKDWRIEMPCTFYDLSINKSLADSLRMKHPPTAKSISSLDEAPRTYKFRGQVKSYRPFESKKVTLSIPQ